MDGGRGARSPPESKMVQKAFWARYLGSFAVCLTVTNFHTYGRALSPKFGSPGCALFFQYESILGIWSTPESWPSVLTELPASNPTPAPFNARVKTDPSAAVNVPAAPAKSCSILSGKDRSLGHTEPSPFGVEAPCFDDTYPRAYRRRDPRVAHSRVLLRRARLLRRLLRRRSLPPRRDRFQ
jgi:hypothetical protein